MAEGKAQNSDIAYAYLKHILKEQGFELDRNFRRRIGSVAKQTGIPFAELLDFGIQLAKDILEEISDRKALPTPEELEGFHHGHGHGGH